MAEWLQRARTACWRKRNNNLKQHHNDFIVRRNAYTLLYFTVGQITALLLNGATQDLL
jgi:hypothetical protein